MNRKIFLISLSASLLITGCAGMGKSSRIGENDGSDPCFTYLNQLDDAAIYYKDQRMKEIAAGALLGGGAGVLTGLAIGRSDTAMIVGGITGAIIGGFAANAYWQNKLRKANNQMDVAIGAVESDVREDIGKLATIDRDMASLVRCRSEQRDQIRKQYSQGILTLQQAQLEWKKWGDLVRKDQMEIKYLDDALDNIRKIEDSYHYAANSYESMAFVTPEMQRQTAMQLEQQKQQVLAAEESQLQAQLSDKKIKKKDKNKLKEQHKQKVAAIQSEFVAKQSTGSNKNARAESLKLMVSSVHEKQESIRKNKEQINNLALEAGNEKGFEQISSQFLPVLPFVNFWVAGA